LRILQKTILKVLVKLKRRHASPTLDEFRPDRVKRVLVVSSTAIGDALFAVPGIRALGSLLPGTEIDLMVRDKVADLFLRSSLVADLLIYKGRYKNALGLLAILVKKPHDLCIVFHDSDPCPVEAAYAAGIPFIFRIGQKDQETSHLLTERIPYDNTKHAIDQRLEVLRFLFKVPLDLPSDLRMELPVDTEEVRAFRKRYLEYFSGSTVDNKSIIGFQFSASGFYKEWPEENFIELGKRLIASNKVYNIALIGASSDRARAKRLAQAINEGTATSNRVLNLTGQISLGQLPAALKAMDVLVTNDTGPLHVAISVGTRTVSLFVPTNVTGTGPMQDLHLHKVITKPKPCSPCVEKYCKQPNCMRLIKVEEVFDCVQEALT